MTLYLPSALLLNHEIHVQLSSAGSHVLPDGTRQNPNICITQLGPNGAPEDTQLYKQLVCKNASYAAKHRGPHQVAMKRNIINNDNNDRGNTFAGDVTACLCDSGAWEG